MLHNYTERKKSCIRSGGGARLVLARWRLRRSEGLEQRVSVVIAPKEVTAAAQGPAALMRTSQGLVAEEHEEEEEEEEVVVVVAVAEVLLVVVTTTLSAHADLWLTPVTSPVTNFTPKFPALFLKPKSSCQGSNHPSFLTPRAPQLMSSTLSHGNLSRMSPGDLNATNETGKG